MEAAPANVGKKVRRVILEEAEYDYLRYRSVNQETRL